MTLAPNDSAGPAPASRRRFAAGWNFTTVEVALVVLAGGLGYLAQQFSLPILNDPALFFAGMLMAVLGIEQIVARLGVYRGDWSYAQVVEIYRSIVVQLWGLILLGFGLIAMLRAVLGWIDPAAADTLINGLFSSTAAIGLVLAVIGLLTALHGLVRALAGSSGADDQNVRGVGDALDRLAGVASLLFGLVLLVAGLFVTLAPDVVTRLISELGSMIVGP